jgi:hypothetical protein
MDVVVRVGKWRKRKQEKCEAVVREPGAKDLLRLRLQRRTRPRPLSATALNHTTYNIDLAAHSPNTMRARKCDASLMACVGIG